MAAGGLKALIPYAVNFSLFAGALYAMTRKPLKAYVYQRHERLRDFVWDSAKAKDAANARLSQSEAKLAGFSAEAKDLLDKATQEAREDARVLADKSRQESERIRSDARQIAEYETAERMTKVKAEFLARAAREAESILTKELKREDHAGLFKRAKNVIEAEAR